MLWELCCKGRCQPNCCSSYKALVNSRGLWPLLVKPHRVCNTHCLLFIKCSSLKATSQGMLTSVCSLSLLSFPQEHFKDALLLVGEFRHNHLSTLSEPSRCSVKQKFSPVQRDVFIKHFFGAVLGLKSWELCCSPLMPQLLFCSCSCIVCSAVKMAKVRVIPCVMGKYFCTWQLWILLPNTLPQATYVFYKYLFEVDNDAWGLFMNHL